MKDGTVDLDARRVARLVGRQFVSWPKDVARRRIIRSLRQIGPSLVLDLWGGGTSATAMSAAGFPVLSVDDGRAFARHDVSDDDGRRSLATCASADGYEWGWGDAAEYASRADAAFLDFMGHWSPDHKSTLIACRHMKAVAVTLMPERTPLGRLDHDDWHLAYVALLEGALRMKVRWVHVYRRNDKNQRATVFFLRPTRHGTVVASRGCMDCGESLRGYPSQTRRCRTCKTTHERTRHQTPKMREVQRVARERWMAANPGYRRPQAQLDEELRKRRERYARDPEYREYMKRRAREYAARKKLAAVSGTAAEAISVEKAA